MFSDVPEEVTHAHTHCVSFDGFDRIVHVMRRRCRTGQMVNLIHFDEQRIDDVMVNELEVLVTEPMLDVTLATGKKVVRNDNLMALHHQVVGQVRSNKTSTASYLKDRKTNKKNNIFV